MWAMLLAVLFIVAFDKESKTMPFATIPVRFFVVVDYGSEDTGCFDVKEVSEHEFLKAEGTITYERHTKRENGVSQIRLTKGLETC